MRFTCVILRFTCSFHLLQYVAGWLIFRSEQRGWGWGMMVAPRDWGGWGGRWLQAYIFQIYFKLSNEITRKYNCVHEYYSRTYLPNFRCIIIICLEVMSHFPNKHIFLKMKETEQLSERKITVIICNSNNM